MAEHRGLHAGTDTAHPLGSAFLSRDQQTTAWPQKVHYLFLYSPEAKNGFHIFKWLKNSPKENMLCDIWKLCEIQISVSMKISWIETASSSFGYMVLWLLWRCNSRVACLWQRLYGPQSRKYLLSDSVQKKFANPWSCWRGRMDTEIHSPKQGGKCHIHTKKRHVLKMQAKTGPQMLQKESRAWLGPWRKGRDEWKGTYFTWRAQPRRGTEVATTMLGMLGNTRQEGRIGFWYLSTLMTRGQQGKRVPFPKETSWVSEREALESFLPWRGGLWDKVFG